MHISYSDSLHVFRNIAHKTVSSNTRTDVILLIKCANKVSTPRKNAKVSIRQMIHCKVFAVFHVVIPRQQKQEPIRFNTFSIKLRRTAVFYQKGQ